jgi:hypothetical protein
MNCPFQKRLWQLPAKLIACRGGFAEWQSKRAGENICEFAVGEGDGICLHAAGVRGLFNQFGRVRGREAEAAKGGDLEMGDEVLHPGNSVGSRGSFVAGEEAGDDFITAEGFAIGLPLAQRGEVCVHDMREQRGANGAVGRGQDAADGAGKSMHGTQPGVRQGKSAEQTGEGHVFAGAVVAAIIKGGAQRARGAGDAVPAEGVGDGVGAVADKGFDELGQSVQPGAGGEVGRQIAGQLRVNDGEAGKHKGTAEADLETVFGRSKNSIAGDFGAGAGGGGNRNERRGGFCEGTTATDDFKIIEKFTAVGEQGGNGLAGVDGAATTEGDDEVAVFARGQGEAVPNSLDFRLARRREDDAVHAVFTKEFKHWSGAKGVASGDDKCAPAKFGGEWCGLADGARAEDDAIGGGEFKAHVADGIRGRANPRGHLRVAGGAGLRHSRRGV